MIISCSEAFWKDKLNIIYELKVKITQNLDAKFIISGVKIKLPTKAQPNELAYSVAHIIN